MPSSLAAAVYESIIAAIYLDGGFEAARLYILQTIKPKIEAIAADEHQQNYKAVLQQHAQKAMGSTPVYEMLDEKGPDHSKCFEVAVTVEGRRFTSAGAPTKRRPNKRPRFMRLKNWGGNTQSRRRSGRREIISGQCVFTPPKASAISSVPSPPNSRQAKHYALPAWRY